MKTLTNNTTYQVKQYQTIKFNLKRVFLLEI